jgi:8-oxo-dGTP pyrophosphatase MutT (NUDIX family)
VGDHVARLRALVGGEELLQIPSVSVAIRDDAGRVLLARHVEGDVWLLPGGAIEPGETPADAAVREAWEEVGLRVRLTALVGVFGGPEFVVRYRNGDRASYVMTVFEATAPGGAARPDGVETTETRWVDGAEASALAVARWVPEVLHAVFSNARGGAFRQPTWVALGRR